MKAPLRVAVLTNFIPPYRLPLFQQLERRGLDLRILVSAMTEKGRDWAPEWGGLPVRLQRSVALSGEWKHPHGFSEPLAIHIPYDTIAQLANFSPDVVISGEMGLRTLQAVAYRCCSHKSRLIVWATVSEITEQGRGAARSVLRRFLLRFADVVMVNGQSGARYVRSLGFGQRPVVTVPQTTGTLPFEALSANRDDPNRQRMLYVGRLIELKGLAPFLAHLSKWGTLNPARTLEMWFAGEGPLRESLASLSLPPNLTLRFLGHIAYERLPEVYRACGILAFPTLADEWGMVVVEAMASGLPVLGSLYSQAAEELVENGQTGWTFRPDRPAEVDDAIQSALSTSTARLNEMATRARERVRNLTPSSMADCVISAIRAAQEARWSRSALPAAE